MLSGTDDPELPGGDLPDDLRRSLVVRRVAVPVIGSDRFPPEDSRSDVMSPGNAVRWVGDLLDLHRDDRNNREERRYKRSTRRYEDIVGMDFSEAVAAAETELDEFSVRTLARFYYPVTNE